MAKKLYSRDILVDDVLRQQMKFSKESKTIYESMPVQMQANLIADSINTGAMTKNFQLPLAWSDEKDKKDEKENIGLLHFTFNEPLENGRNFGPVFRAENSQGLNYVVRFLRLAVDGSREEFYKKHFDDFKLHQSLKHPAIVDCLLITSLGLISDEDEIRLW